MNLFNFAKIVKPRVSTNLGATSEPTILFQTGVNLEKKYFQTLNVSNNLTIKYHMLDNEMSINSPFDYNYIIDNYDDAICNCKDIFDFTKNIPEKINEIIKKIYCVTRDDHKTIDRLVSLKASIFIENACITNIEAYDLLKEIIIETKYNFLVEFRKKIPTSLVLKNYADENKITTYTKIPNTGHTLKLNDKSVVYSGGSVYEMLYGGQDNNKFIDLDIFLIGDVNLKIGLIQEIIQNLMNVFGESNILYVVDRSICNVWIKGINRSIQLIAFSDKDNYAVINRFDISYLKSIIYFSDIDNKYHSLTSIEAIKSMYTREVFQEDISKASVARLMRAIERGFKVNKSLQPTLDDQIIIYKNKAIQDLYDRTECLTVNFDENELLQLYGYNKFCSSLDEINKIDLNGDFKRYYNYNSVNLKKCNFMEKVWESCFKSNLPTTLNFKQINVPFTLCRINNIDNNYYYLVKVIDENVVNIIVSIYKTFIEHLDQAKRYENKSSTRHRFSNIITINGNLINENYDCEYINDRDTLINIAQNIPKGAEPLNYEVGKQYSANLTFKGYIHPKANLEGIKVKFSPN